MAVPSRLRARRAAAAALVLAVAGAACVSDPFEGVDLILDVTDARVELGAVDGTIEVRSGETTVKSSVVANASDIGEVRELRWLAFGLADLSFQASGAPAAGVVAGAAGAAAHAFSSAASGSGTISLGVFLNGVPVPGTPILVTVTDGVVTQVIPSLLLTASWLVKASELLALLESLPPGSQPDLKDWENLTLDQVIAEINQGLAAASLPVVLVATADGDLDGSLRLHAFEFAGRVVLSN